MCFFESSTPEHVFKDDQLEQSKNLFIKICSTGVCLRQLTTGKSVKITYTEMDLKNENGLLGVQMNRIAQMVNCVDNALLVVNLHEYSVENEDNQNKIEKLDPFWSLLRLLSNVRLVVFENSCNIETNRLKIDSNALLFSKLSDIVLKKHS